MLKLVRRLGQAAAWNFVCLVLWTSENRSDGELDGLSDEDIELAAEWDGEPGVFVNAISSVRFLDGEPGEYRLHDWADHNPWAAGAAKRSAKARWNAAKRHHGQAEADLMVPEYAAVRAANSKSDDANSKDADASSTTNDATGKEQHASSNAPSPSPSPSPSPIETYPGFASFWKTWPVSDRKQARGKCLDAWKKAKAEADAALIVAHVERMKRSPGWTKDGGEFVPAPLVYLNQRRWEGTADAAAPDGTWWSEAGFSSVHEATNARCYEHNAADFRDGRRVQEVIA
jgi:hypothetical protein